MTTTNMGWETLQSNSLQPSVPFNAALADIDACLAGTVTLNLIADANYTLIDDDYNTSALIITDTGALLTAGRDIVFPAHFPKMYVKNSTAQTLTLKKSGQAGIALGAGSFGIFFSGPIDVERGSGDSAAVTTVNGDNGTVIVLAPLIVACSDETTALAAGTTKVTFRLPYAMTLTEVPRASLTTAQTSGSIFTVDINENGTSILSTKLTIDNGEKTSTTAATPAVLSDTALANDAEITVDIDQVGDSTAKGLKVTLIGYAS